ncbi:hypothetical protein E2C01_023150 [Portunus trituberculatus]|uniref:Uncharacterized protein n=1 Tax=Portunus trituberculatus TaxID=210409 RepID=A0A5B7E816_PORTR|nr:hypothetical protein [Portunus trituberculatus]
MRRPFEAPDDDGWVRAFCYPWPQGKDHMELLAVLKDIKLAIQSQSPVTGRYSVALLPETVHEGLDSLHDTQY